MPRFDTNAEPLLVNYVDTWRIRPEAVTRIPNLFLASDYVRTFTDLATMEAANEAARRAVNGIIRAARSDAEPCGIWNLHEPETRPSPRVRPRSLPAGSAVERQPPHSTPRPFWTRSRPRPLACFRASTD